MANRTLSEVFDLNLDAFVSYKAQHENIKFKLDTMQSEREKVERELQILYDKQYPLHKEKNELKAKLSDFISKFSKDSSDLLKTFNDIEVVAHTDIPLIDLQVVQCSKAMTDSQQTSRSLQNVRENIYQLVRDEKVLSEQLEKLRETCCTLRVRYDKGEEVIASAIRSIDEQTSRAVSSLKRNLEEVYNNNAVPSPVPSPVPSYLYTDDYPIISAAMSPYLADNNNKKKCVQCVKH